MLPKLLVLALALAAAASPRSQDLDLDGLPDRFEQELLTRFLPEFQISRTECDGLPSQFAPGSAAPKVIAHNGVIYGRVVPRSATTIEIQYFHLWARDCGPFPHGLDVEHVSALITAKDLRQPARKWKAITWYAGAHEDTPCNNSGFMRASAIAGETKGPKVWVSRGKHASYLQLERCAAGCRTDNCRDARPMTVAHIINLGEPDAPLNGSYFIQSSRWRFRDKLRTDFARESLNLPRARY